MTTEQKLDKISDDVNSIRISIARIEERIAGGQEMNERTENRLDGYERRIANLEKRPGRWWDKLLGAGLVAAAGTFVAWLIEKLK